MYLFTDPTGYVIWIHIRTWAHTGLKKQAFIKAADMTKKPKKEIQGLQELTESKIIRKLRQLRDPMLLNKLLEESVWYITDLQQKNWCISIRVQKEDTNEKQSFSPRGKKA